MQGRGVSRTSKSSRQQRIDAQKAEEKRKREAERRAARRGGEPPKAKGGNTTGGKTKPQPDTTDRNQPCNRALAHKPHGAHRYRKGDQQMHCPGVS